MSAEDRQQLKNLFHAAVDLEAGERTAFLDEVCAGRDELRGQVEKLLASHYAAGTFLAAPALVDAGVVAAEEPAGEDQATSLAGQRIGPYELAREIGRGGMGKVYLAVRADDHYRQQVAVKLIKRGMDTAAILRRFVMERQILANLEHPHIARLLDGGTTADGLPYFVMEHIAGRPITRYCDEQRSTTAERLELFRQVCAAVQYAHQHLVVHRDIKPSNILVTTEGVPKLLDFGIAVLLSPNRASETGEATLSMTQAMTPEYASPEQLRGQQITTASDIYSLGIVLYELLSGHRPYHLSSHQPQDIAQVISEKDPRKPSAAITVTEEVRSTEGHEIVVITPEAVGRAREGTIEKLRRRLTGDLDNIVLKALRKEPERRYASVQEFSEDIRRHLAGLPVSAGPDTLSYRARKFTRRHKAGVLAAAVVVITLFTATAVTTWQASIARQERDKAERRFNQVRKLANSVLFDYHDGVEQLPGSTPVRQKMVQDALEYLDNLSAESNGEASLQRELATGYEKVGDVQGNPYRANLGNQEEALASYRKAVSIREALYAANRDDVNFKLEVSQGYQNVADILWAQGANEEALANYRHALANYSELAQADPNNPLYVKSANVTLNGIGNVQRQNGDFAGALATFRNYLANAEALLAADATDQYNRHSLAIARLKVGDALMGGTDYAGALTHYEKAVENFSDLAAAAENNAAAIRELGLGYGRIAAACKSLAQYERAAEYDLKAIQQQKQVAAADPTNVQIQFDLATTYANLGDNLRQMKKLDDAAARVRESIGIFNEALAKSPDFAQAQGNLAAARTTYAEILLAQGDTNGALENYRLALTMLERAPVRQAQTEALANAYEGVGNVHLRRAERARGQTSQSAADCEEARSWYQKSLDVWRELDAAKHKDKLSDISQKLAACNATLTAKGKRSG